MKPRLFGSSRSLRAAALFALLPVIAASRPAAASFSSCVSGLREAAVRAGVGRSVTSRALNIAEPDEKILRLSEVQPEFKTPIWDYLGFLVDEQRVADGRAMMRQYDQILRAAERRFGVDRHVIAAVWGVETDYGREAGDNYLPHALATLVCEGGRRTNFWRGELIAALKLVDDGDLQLDELFGSWAGAFGQTQFIPSTYQRLAVDFDGDGRRDHVRSVADALGSTANYLKRSGWQPGDPWMIEVTVPRDYDGRRAINHPCRAARGATSCVPTGRCQPARGPASSCRPGRRGRAFSCSATSTRSIPTIRPNPTRSPSPISPTASPATRRFAPPGRPTIPA